MILLCSQIENLVWKVAKDPQALTDNYVTVKVDI